MNGELGVRGDGGVARSASSFLGAWNKPYAGVSDPLIMEVLALRDAVKLANIRGFTQVLMETDYLQLVELWYTQMASRSVVAPLLDEIG